MAQARDWQHQYLWYGISSALREPFPHQNVLLNIGQAAYEAKLLLLVMMEDEPRVTFVSARDIQHHFFNVPGASSSESALSYDRSKIAAVDF